jgi:integration host factor subunit alpha
MKVPSYWKQNTVTRESIARAIKRDTGVAINQAGDIVDQVLDIFTTAICNGESLKIRLFGSFSIKKKNARIGRNPKTMEEAKIPARVIVKFKVAPTLKKRINSNINMITRKYAS